MKTSWCTDGNYWVKDRYQNMVEESVDNSIARENFTDMMMKVQGEGMLQVN